ncbi:MAG: lycopene cyclase domain-containing protein [bacterium]
MPEYSILVALSLIIVFVIDTFILKINLWKQPRFYVFLFVISLLQTVVDNWLNGRWWYGSYIVGPYGSEFYSNIKIWNSPIENYFYGWGLLWLNLSLFEYFLKRKRVINE